MLDSTLELINLVSSNSHLMFCFCNLIIGILFVTNSKTIQRHRCRDSATNVDDKKQAGDVVLMSTTTSVKKASLSVVTEVQVVIPDVVEVISEEEDDDHLNGDEQNEDELRRRAEEFIEKVNRSWRAERSGSFPQRGHRERLQGHLGRSRTIVM